MTAKIKVNIAVLFNVFTMTMCIALAAAYLLYDTHMTLDTFLPPAIIMSIAMMMFILSVDNNKPRSIRNDTKDNNMKYNNFKEYCKCGHSYGKHRDIGKDNQHFCDGYTFCFCEKFIRATIFDRIGFIFDNFWPDGDWKGPEYVKIRG